MINTIEWLRRWSFTYEDGKRDGRHAAKSALRRFEPSDTYRGYYCSERAWLLDTLKVPRWHRRRYRGGFTSGWIAVANECTARVAATAERKFWQEKGHGLVEAYKESKA